MTHEMVWWSADGADLPFSPPHGHLGTSGHHTLANFSIFPRACLNTDFWALPSVSDSVPLGVEPRMCILFVFLREISMDSSIREGTFLHLSFSFLKMCLFLFGCTGSWLLRSESVGATLLLWCPGFLLRWLLLLLSTGSGCTGFSSCDARA